MMISGYCSPGFATRDYFSYSEPINVYFILILFVSIIRGFLGRLKRLKTDAIAAILT